MEISREKVQLLSAKLQMAPAVAILGPRQVGKTTLAIQAAKASGTDFLYLDMESGQDVAKLGDDFESFFEFYQKHLVIIDEVQALPVLFSRLRSVIDKNKRNGRFMLLGSASPNLVHGVSESLAGRVSYLDLHPFSLSEVGTNYRMQFHWFRGGFPRAFLAESDAMFTDWMQSYVRTYIQTDLSNLFGYNLNPAITQRLWYMLAHLHGSVTNIQDLSRSVGVTAPVINRYIDFLEGAFLVFKLRPWFNNASKRLVKAPKIYIKDSGLLHSLLSIANLESLLVHPIVGASWEGYVIEQIMYHTNKNFGFHFYRTHTGTEIDLVIVNGAIPIAAIEIKLGNVPTPSKGFFIGISDLGTVNNFIITPTSDTYPYKNAIVCSLHDFLKVFLPKLS